MLNNPLTSRTVSVGAEEQGVSTMRNLSLALLSAGAALIGTAAAASGPAAPPAATQGWTGGHVAPRPAPPAHRWGPRYQGRWYAGWRAPGGWNAYRRPAYGYVLPRYWVDPSYYIANYSAYGLPAPAYGYGWSRYYDDAVMTDRYGRVYDHRRHIDWNRYEGGYGPDGDYADAPGYDGPPPPARPGASYDRDYRYADDGVTTGNEYDYDGRWTGTWTTEDGRKVQGTYDGRFEGQVRGAGMAHGAHWDGGPPMPPGGYVSGGYYYPAPIVTTVTVQPAVTTTTTTTYVTEKVVYRKPVRKARRTCRCK